MRQEKNVSCTKNVYKAPLLVVIIFYTLDLRNTFFILYYEKHGIYNLHFLCSKIKMLCNCIFPLCLDGFFLFYVILC